MSATVVILIDGVHRWHAFKQAGRTDIPVVHYQDTVLDYEAAKTDLLLESARNNTTHGDRLTLADKKRIARDIAAADPGHGLYRLPLPHGPGPGLGIAPDGPS